MTNVYPLKCRIRNDGGGPARVDIYDDIGAGGWFADGVSAADFAGQIATVKGPLDVHINSGGGDVFDGIAIASAIRAHKGRVTTVVDGLAASIASVIVQAGQERVVQPGSMLMIHEASGMCVGDAAEMTSMAGTLDKVSGNIASVYAGRSGRDQAYWRGQMKTETWYTADEAVAEGLADRVGDGEAQLPAGLDLAALGTVPGRIAARLRTMPAAAAPAQPSTADMHGDHERYDPDGDGDCDACPEGDTDHDYWAPDGTQLKPVPGKPMPASALTAEEIRAIIREELRAASDGVDNSEWDASKAWHNGATSDDPAAFYNGICAGKKDGDPATQEAHALPYKYHPSGPPNAAGVKAALGRLPQTQGLTNEAEAKALLQRLMKKINPDYEPEDHAQPDLSGIDLGQLGNALKGAFA